MSNKENAGCNDQNLKHRIKIFYKINLKNCNQQLTINNFPGGNTFLYNKDELPDIRSSSLYQFYLLSISGTLLYICDKKL